jgi:hypothetical protein
MAEEATTKNLAQSRIASIAHSLEQTLRTIALSNGAFATVKKTAWQELVFARPRQRTSIAGGVQTSFEAKGWCLGSPRIS